MKSVLAIAIVCLGTLCICQAVRSNTRHASNGYGQSRLGSGFEGMSAAIDHNGDLWVGGETPLSQRRGLVEEALMRASPVHDFKESLLDYRSPAVSIARLTSNGSPMEPIRLITNPMGSSKDNNWANITNVVVDHENRIVIGGWKRRESTWFGPPNDIVVRRYLPTGESDEHFGQKGFLRDRLRLEDGVVLGFGVDSRNGIVLALSDARRDTGWPSRDNFRIVLTKYLENGEIDKDFGDDGFSAPGILFANHTPVLIEVDEQGRYTLAGSSPVTRENRGTSDLTPGLQVLRMLEDGHVDSTLNAVNVRLSTVAITQVKATGLLIDKHERMMVSGIYKTAGDRKDYPFLVRVLPNGELDLSFASGSAGITAPDADASIVAITLSLDPQDRPSIAATYRNHRRLKTIITRFTVDGNADPGFAEGHGITLDNINMVNISNDAAGKLYVTGMEGFQVHVSRFTESGSLDQEFR